MAAPFFCLLRPRRDEGERGKRKGPQIRAARGQLCCFLFVLRLCLWQEGPVRLARYAFIGGVRLMSAGPRRCRGLRRDTWLSYHDDGGASDGLVVPRLRRGSSGL